VPEAPESEGHPPKRVGDDFRRPYRFEVARHQRGGDEGTCREGEEDKRYVPLGYLLPIDLEGEYGWDGGVARIGHYGDEGQGELAHVASGRRHALWYWIPTMGSILRTCSMAGRTGEWTAAKCVLGEGSIFFADFGLALVLVGRLCPPACCNGFVILFWGGLYV